MAGMSATSTAPAAPRVEPIASPTLEETLTELARSSGTAVLRVRSGVQAAELRVDRGRILTREGLQPAAAEIARLLSWSSASVERLPAGARPRSGPLVALPTHVVLDEAKAVLRRAQKVAAAFAGAAGPVRAVLPAPAGLGSTDALVLARFASPRTVVDVLLERFSTVEQTGESIARLLATRRLLPATESGGRSTPSVRPSTAPSPAEAVASSRACAAWWDRDHPAPVCPVPALPAVALASVERALGSAPSSEHHTAIAMVRALTVEPAPPPSSLGAVVELASLLRGEGTSLALVAEVLTRHRALAVAVIGEASAAAHGRTIDSLERAVLRVGLERVHHLACELVLDEVAGRTPRSSVRMERRTALVVAKLAGALAPRPVRTDAMLAGLFSGLGHILLEVRSGQLVDRARLDVGARFHATIAAVHAAHWGLPFEVVMAVGQYVRPVLEHTDALTRIVRAARIAATLILSPEKLRVSTADAARSIAATGIGVDPDEVLARARTLGAGG